MKQTFLNKNQIKLGDSAPNFKAVDKDIKDVTLDSLGKKIKVITSFPSIDTGVCDIQAKTFSEKLSGVQDIELILISRDLPFAQSRWCGVNKSEAALMLSDYKYNDFAEKYGLKLEGLELVGRAVIILDENNKVTYLEICENVGDHPNYDAAFKALNID